jgi:hypothetical protein
MQRSGGEPARATPTFASALSRLFGHGFFAGCYRLLRTLDRLLRDLAVLVNFVRHARRAFLGCHRESPPFASCEICNALNASYCNAAHDSASVMPIMSLSLMWPVRHIANDTTKPTVLIPNNTSEMYQRSDFIAQCPDRPHHPCLRQTDRRLGMLQHETAHDS